MSKLTNPRRRHRPCISFITVFLVAMSAGLLTTAAQALPGIKAAGLFRGQAILVIDGKQRLLKDGQTSPEGVTLVQSTPRQAEVEFEGQRLSLTLDGSIGGALPSAPALKVVRLVAGARGHYYADGQVNGRPIRFLVDTGATTIAMNKPTARALGIPFLVEGQKRSVSTANGVVGAWLVQLDEVKVESIALKRVSCMVVDGAHPAVALLGQSFLNRLDSSRSGGVLELRERR